MKSKTQKIQELKQLKEKIPGSTIVVFTTFSRVHSAGFPRPELGTKAGQTREKGLSVSQMSELKRTLRSLNSEYLVAKKSLMDLALKSLKLKSLNGEVDVFGIEGSVGLAFGPPSPSGSGEASGDDYYAVAKKLYEFSKKNPALQFFGAFVKGSFIDADKFMEIAKMPLRETLIARLLGMMKYPISGLYTVLDEVSKQHALASSS